MPPGFVGARVIANSAQSIADTANVPVSFDAAEFDTSGFWSAGAPTKLTVPTTGYYEMGAQLPYTGGVGGYVRSIYLYINGNRTEDVNESPPGGGNISYQNAVFGPHHLTAGDYIEFNAYQDSGSALNLYNSTLGDGYHTAARGWIWLMGT